MIGSMKRLFTLSAVALIAAAALPPPSEAQQVLPTPLTDAQYTADSLACVRASSSAAKAPCLRLASDAKYLRLLVKSQYFRVVKETVTAPTPPATSTPTTTPTTPPDSVSPPTVITTPLSQCGNEPAGFRRQVDVGFNVLPGLNEMSSEGSVTWSTADLQNLRIVTDTTAPRGGSVLQIQFPAGLPGGGAPARLLVAIANGTPAGATFAANQGDIYSCFFIKRSAGWSDNGNSGTKVLFQRPDNSGGINHYLSYDAAQNPVACFPSPAAYDCRRSAANSAPDGVWHKIESLWIAGSAGLSSGSARLWVDGKLVVDATNILMFPSGTNPHQDFVMFWPTYGGGQNPVPKLQYMWIDHLIVSVR